MGLYIIWPQAVAADIGRQYIFRGARGRVQWPMDDGANLGPVGAWNVFHRLGYRPRWLWPDDEVDPAADDVLVASASGPLSLAVERVLRQFLDAGARVVAAGRPEAWRGFLPVEPFRCGYPYAAHAVLADKPYLMAPQLWTLARVEGGEQLDRLVAVRGERQTPARALYTPLDHAPAAVRHGRLLYLNANPFAAFQAWLQGQEPLGPWLNYRDRLFWLDEWCADLAQLLARWGALPDDPQPIDGLAELTVMLRHDTDDSTDPTLIEIATRHGVRATYAVLLDRNASSWRHMLAGTGHEAAFHYDTLRWNLMDRELQRLGVHRHLTGDRRKVCGRGLARQVERAKRNGLGVQSLHRHFSWMFYPEWIDALDWTFKMHQEVRITSSLFRGHVLRWGAKWVDGTESTAGQVPDAQFPFWFPFKVAHAGDGGRPLRGWESTMIMEAEPELVTQMLDRQNRCGPHRVLSFTYHPAHARRNIHNPGGTAIWFERVLSDLRQRNIGVMTFAEVAEVLDGGS